MKNRRRSASKFACADQFRKVKLAAWFYVHQWKENLLLLFYDIYVSVSGVKQKCDSNERTPLVYRLCNVFEAARDDCVYRLTEEVFDCQPDYGK